MGACTTLLEELVLIVIIWIKKKGAKVYLMYLINLPQKHGADYSCFTDSKAYSQFNTTQMYTVHYSGIICQQVRVILSTYMTFLSYLICRIN